MTALSRALVCTALCLAPPLASAAVVNGGFESLSGTGFTGWTIQGAGIAPDSTFPNTGANDASFYDVTTASSALTQSIATTPGGSYALSFSLLDESGLGTDQFTVTFGGITARLTGDQAAPPGQSATFYTKFTFTVPGAAILASQTNLSFTGAVDAVSVTAWNLDDVSLTALNTPPPPPPPPAPGNVPAPGGTALVAAGLAWTWARARAWRRTPLIR